METETGDGCKCKKNTISKLHKQISKKKKLFTVQGRQASVLVKTLGMIHL